MKKQLSRMLYMTMTFVLIFSMIASNIVLVTSVGADTEEATYENLMKQYNEYKEQGNYLFGNEKLNFVALMDKIADLGDPIEVPEKPQQEDYKDDDGNDDVDAFDEARAAYDAAVEAEEEFNGKVETYFDQLQSFIDLINKQKEKDEINDKIDELTPVIDQLDKRYDELKRFADPEVQEAEKENYFEGPFNDFINKLQEVKTTLDDYNDATDEVKANYELKELEGLLADFEGAIAALSQNKIVEPTKLADLYERLSKVKKENYTANTWNVLQVALKEAKSLLDYAKNKPVSQGDIDTRYKALEDAEKSLTQRGDITKLENKYEEYRQYDESDYTVDSWTVFENKLAEVKTDIDRFKESDTISQKEMDDVEKSLTAAARNLVKRGDISQLRAEYDRILDSKEIDGVEQYTANSWKELEEKILDDLEDFFYSDDNYANESQPEINKRLQDLKRDANRILKKRGNLSILEDRYNDMLKNQVDKYTANSWAPFETVLDDIYDFLYESDRSDERSNADDRAVKEKLDMLDAAAKKLVPRGDLISLETATEKYSNYNELNYTESTWKAFDQALDEALNFLMDAPYNENLTQKEVDDQLSALDKAHDNLAEKGDPRELENFYKENVKEKEDKYTRDSWGPFEKALEQVEQFLYDDPAALDDVTQAQVDEQFDNLQGAFNDLDKRGDIQSLQRMYDQYIKELTDEKAQESFTTSSWEAYAEELTDLLKDTAAYLERAKDEDIAANISEQDIDAEKNKIKPVYDKLEGRGDPSELRKNHARLLVELDEKRQSELYTTASLDALEKELGRIANTFLNDEELLADSTQGDVDRELEKLRTAEKGVELKGEIKDLKKEYDKALKELNDNRDNYTTSSAKALEEELEKVFTEYLDGNDDLADASQSEVDAAKEKIIQFYNGLTPRGNSDDLMRLYADYLNIDLEKYTKKTRDKLQKAMDEVDKFLEDGSVDDAVQADIDKMFENLQSLRKALVEKGDVTSLQAEYDRLSQLSESDYNVGSWRLFKNKFDRVGKFLENTDTRENAEPAKVEEMLNLLKSAESSLEKEPVDFTEVEEAFNTFKADYPEADIKKYASSEKEANAIIEKLKEIENFITVGRENATNSQAAQYVAELNALHAQLADRKKVYDLEKEYDKVTDGLSKEEKEEHEDILKEIEEYFKGNRGEITDEKTKEYLERLKEIAAAGKKDENPKQDGSGNQSGGENTSGDGADTGGGNTSGDGSSSGDGSTSGDGTDRADVEDPLTLSETIEKFTSDPVGTVKGAVLPNTASDNYKYVVVGVLMIVEGLFLYGYFRFFSFLRTRFDLF